ncbi:ABC transporter permease [Bacillaceae bacterium Marseille-Q3522]|nr:ABC transporter permease [Bacillaceae bacterium Marseille-Q3522]
MMISLIWKEITRRKGTALLFITALTIILAMISLSTTALQQSQTQVETDITYYARGSYDLLVRPQGTEHELEKTDGIVPENYLSFGQGGISRSQWETIKNRPDIEIAAPVASLGYFTGIKSNVGFVPPEQATRYQMEYVTSDGVHNYPIDKPYSCVLLEATGNSIYEGEFEPLSDNAELLDYCSDRIARFLMPPTFHLLVAVDPEAEQALTGIDFTKINEDSPATGWGTTAVTDNQEDIPIVPLIQRKDSGVSLFVDAKIDKLNINKEQTQVYRDRLGLVPYDSQGEPRQKNTFYHSFESNEYKSLVNELFNYPETSSKSIHVNIGSSLNPFNNTEGVLISDIEEKVIDTGKYNDGIFFQDIDLRYMAKHYFAGDVKYERNNDHFTIKKVADENGVPIYRNIIEKGLTQEEATELGTKVPFMLDPVGEFDAGSYEEKLASSPLGIYRLAPVSYIGDGEDDAVEMKATVTPGSFVSDAATGVTNIKSAELIKGETPIDAIRVKVAGITGYTPEAAEKINHIASEIEEMGLNVTVIAGASPQKLDVEVEGVGLVRESWTTLGAAGTIISEWNVTTIVLAISFLFVTAAYILNRVRFWQVNKAGDFLLFQQLGWERKHTNRLFRSEIGVLAFFSWLLSFILVIAIYFWQKTEMTIFLWHLIMTIVIAFTTLVLVSTKMANQKRQVISKTRHSRNKPAQLLQWRNITFFRKYIRAPFLQLLLVNALSSFVYLCLTETVRRTSVTILGEYVNLQISNWHVLLIISTYILAFITLIESLTSLLKARQSEIGTFRSIGWKISHIYRLYLSEIALWAGMALLIGAAVSILLYAAFYQVHVSVWIVLLASFAGFYVLILLVSSIVLYYYLRKRIGDTLVVRRKKQQIEVKY